MEQPDLPPAAACSRQGLPVGPRKRGCARAYQWAKKGTRPRQPKDQRCENAYLFGAVCPSRDTGAAIIMPHANTAAMRKHLEEISRAVAPGAHGLIILDQAGWHTTRKLKVPKNLTMVPLQPACPELNAAENIWQYLRQTYLKPDIQELYRHSQYLPGRLAKAPRPFSCSSRDAPSNGLAHVSLLRL
jgi:hypothetical protein